jgi:hypothetical protein
MNNSNLAMTIFYRSDRLSQDLLSSARPLLFYAFDDVSGTTNLGSLNGNQYSPQWMSAPGSFNCSWSGASGSSSRPKLLQLLTATTPWLQLTYNLSLSVYYGCTWAVWFQVSNYPSSSSVILLEGMLGDPTNDNNRVFSMRIDSSGNYIHNILATQYLNLATINSSWTHLALRVTSSNYSGVVDGMEQGSMTIQPNLAAFGNYLNFGHRTWQTDPGWNGCLAHAMLFNKTLTVDEVKMFSSLLGDDVF